MDAGPQVSICIPTYNQADYLPLAVQSALGQDCDDVEVVISDNHCTDGTAEYLATVRDSRVRVVQPERHLRMAENWAYCIGQSRGEYVNILSSDDILLPGYARTLSEQLSAHPTAAFAYCAARLIDRDGRLIGVERHVGGSFFRTGRAQVERFIWGAGCVFPTLMIRRRCYETAGGFGSWDFLGDWELELRLLQTGDLVYCDEVLVQYRIWTTRERDGRLVAQVDETVRLYETTVRRMTEGSPGLAALARRAREQLARHYALALAGCHGRPEFQQAIPHIRRLSNSLSVRFLLSLHRFGLSGPIRGGFRAKQWLRQKTKALLYPT